MNYSPAGMYIWDAWYMPVPGGLHMYHLQRTRHPGDAAADRVQDQLGHAFTTDLIDWRELAPVLGPNPADPDDDRQPWTGSAVHHQGKSYLYYTMRGSRTDCREQHIGLAMGDDGNAFVRYAGNPVITPDPRWYATPAAPTHGTVDCRDLIVIKDPAGPGWYGYFATRRPAATLPETTVIGCAYSDDLLQWRQLPPAFTSAKYACVEVPDVFFMDGRWYMTCLTGNIYGNRRIFTDPNLCFGTIYLVAEHPAGPFYELADNVLLGAKASAPLSVRSFLWEGERHILYTDRERGKRSDGEAVGFGTVTTPKVLKTSGDALGVAYSDRIEKKAGKDIVFDWETVKKKWAEAWGQLWPLQSGQLSLGDAIRITNPTCWSVLPLAQPLPSFILEAEVTLEDCSAAGFCVRQADRGSGDLLMLDAREQAVHFEAHPWCDFIEKRQAAITQHRPYRLRVVNRLEHLEVYVDDILKLAFSRYRGIGGDLGLFVESGSAVFRNLRLRELNVVAPQ